MVFLEWSIGFLRCVIRVRELVSSLSVLVFDVSFKMADEFVIEELIVASGSKRYTVIFHSLRLMFLENQLNA